MVRVRRGAVAAVVGAQRTANGSPALRRSGEAAGSARRDLVSVRALHAALARPGTGGFPERACRRRGPRPIAGAWTRQSAPVGPDSALRGAQRAASGARSHVAGAGAGAWLHAEP